jgi:hypothetical protein
MSQTEKIKNYLQKGKKISPILALNKFGCFRLAARIRELKDQGLNVKTEIVYTGNKHHAVYSL